MTAVVVNEEGERDLPDEGVPDVYFGPAGTFTHEAALLYRRGNAENLEPVATIIEACRAVADRRARCAYVPAENNIGGSVVDTLDAMTRVPGLRICGEVIIPVIQCLIAYPGVDLTAVTKIYSHPQSLMQCRGYLERRFTGIETEAALSNADAVQRIRGKKDQAAIGPAIAAEIYGAQVRDKGPGGWGIQDSRLNVTKFWVLQHETEEPPQSSGEDKTAFTLVLRNQPGALLMALQQLYTASPGPINVARMDQRPLPGGELGAYVWIFELDADYEDSRVPIAAIRRLPQVLKLTFLGSYPAWQQPNLRSVEEAENDLDPRVMEEVEAME